MKGMKRVLFVIFALMFAVSFTACGSGSDDSNSDSADGSSTDEGRTPIKIGLTVVPYHEF